MLENPTNSSIPFFHHTIISLSLKNQHLTAKSADSPLQKQVYPALDIHN
jgi:hypothetical protein